ncbi:hypothetical protein HWV62_2506 [Athelia sp. TMB]|nr:hypothetical protein HWV62_2506 [Athelia sp. TMB]
MAMEWPQASNKVEMATYNNSNNLLARQTIGVALQAIRDDLLALAERPVEARALADLAERLGQIVAGAPSEQLSPPEHTLFADCFKSIMESSLAAIFPIDVPIWVLDPSQSPTEHPECSKVIHRLAYRMYARPELFEGAELEARAALDEAFRQYHVARPFRVIAYDSLRPERPLPEFRFALRLPPLYLPYPSEVDASLGRAILEYRGWIGRATV